MTDLIRPPLRAGDLVSDNAAHHIFNGVAGRTLPRPEWTHHAHLVFATVLLDRHSLERAEAAAPGLIRAYNASVGGVNDDTQGYHHTITLLFLRHISEYVRPLAGESVGERATKLLNSPLAASDYPLRFYTKERLFSIEARRNWVEPDLEAPLF